MKTITLAAAVHKLVSPEPQLDPEIAERVGQEILRDQLEPGAWATALAASGGKKQDALAVYARIRIRKLANERRTRQAKSRSFEARRLNTCLGIKTVQDLLDRSNRGGRLNLIRPKLSVIWLLILMLGCTGSMACLARLLEPFMADRFEKPALFAAPFAGIAAVGFALLARALMPKNWVMHGWNTGLSFVGAMACFGSLYLGAKLVARTPPAAIQEMTRFSHSAPAAPVRQSAPDRATPVLVTPKTVHNATAFNRASADGQD
ncbi:hypothetical protein OJ996_12930 [Luteolibacter sp. GHJ8]|uniref:Uncharacterized protein n=1 Tax=Luteolibacter rhizosphaerae TaxID=2989719 RepID=A0ABT3G3R3_9BACT|nr:hypothetical protein [Luteolibacter rhizosphaerae]MCW1914485.1 hypothetical protein [Luteolibacter rhizosphaerae]